MRFDLYGQDMAFADAQIWKTWVAIGFADAVHFVAFDTKQRHSYPLRGYFGHLYPTEDFLLVASASDLLCFDPEVRLQWTVANLGIDGVVITSVENDMVRGEGECVPCILLSVPSSLVEWKHHLLWNLQEPFEIDDLLKTVKEALCFSRRETNFS